MQDNTVEIGTQPYEPFMFARKHHLSITIAREICDQFGRDRSGADAAASKWQQERLALK
jgi:hypothetical protein